jgi:hypothetical protein
VPVVFGNKLVFGASVDPGATGSSLVTRKSQQGNYQQRYKKQTPLHGKASLGFDKFGTDN